MTSSGRDWDDSAVRLVSRASSAFVSVEIFLLILSVSSDMRGGGGIVGIESLLIGLISRFHFMDQVAEFYRRELTQALNEQTFGISCSEIICSTENEAQATVTLLEGNTITVVLSSAGYKVWQQWTRRFYI
jgi:hypothetical protein